MTRILLLFVCCITTASQAQVYKDTKASVEERVADVLSKMTTEEKIDYIGGSDDFYIRGIERLGLPAIKMTDGPVGTRNDGNTTAYPASILTAATWDTVLAHRLGEALGKDARQRGVHILLAPGVNIYRAPMNGRNFEYLGEDPFLAGKMAASYIKGVQSKGVVATVKHFAANNQEWDRNNVSSDIDERVLQEIYLPAFKMAIQEGGAGAVMNSYNLLNGIHATQNKHLNLEILKGDWKFDGILMSDWVATYDGVLAANAGLDLEMPSGAFMNRQTLLPALKDGRVSQSVIDDKVRRILRIIFRFGFYDTPYKMTTTLVEDAESKKVALDLARNGIVLLKNKNLLPLSRSIRSIAVIGPNASGYVAGGGSSYTKPFHSVSLIDGIKQIVPSAKLIISENALPTMESYIDSSPFYVAAGSNEKGLKAAYFDNQEMKGNALVTVTDSHPDHNWAGSPEAAGIPADHFSMRFTGVVRPVKSASYTFAVRGDDGYRLFVNGEKVIDMWRDQAAALKTTELKLVAGKEYNILLEYYENGGDARIAFAVYNEQVDFSEARNAAAQAQVAILSVGFDQTSEGEGADRTFELPPYQAELIRTVSKANPNTIVILNAGGNTDMQSWLPSVKALLHAWYPGQEGGTATAEILFGLTNPSGKLPASFEKKFADNPVANNYYDENNDKRVFYKEGLALGYRYYDKAAMKPQFPFGFGLSYTTFSYSDLKISQQSTGNYLVSFTISNTGKYDGAESAQVYVHQQHTPVMRPVKELKGFTKVFLKKGEAKSVSVLLDHSSFSYYKLGQHAFGYDPGNFEIIIAASSQDIRLHGQIDVK